LYVALKPSLVIAADIIAYQTGLFSVTVTAFIIESYKQLRPDSGDTIVLLLAQISQQLAALSNGTPISIPSTLSSQTFRPSALQHLLSG
jgi:hypothetical protein